MGTSGITLHDPPILVLQLAVKTLVIWPTSSRWILFISLLNVVCRVISVITSVPPVSPNVSLPENNDAVVLISTLFLAPAAAANSDRTSTAVSAAVIILVNLRMVPRVRAWIQGRSSPAVGTGAERLHSRAPH